MRYSIPIYPGEFYTARTAKAFNRTCSMVLTPPGYADPCTLGACSHAESKDGGIRIVAGVWSSPRDRVAVIAHEATHAAQTLALFVCMDYRRETEGFAYLVQWFAEKLAKDC